MGEEIEIDVNADAATRRILGDCMEAIGTLDMAGRRAVLRQLAAALLPSEEGPGVLSGGKPEPGEK